MGEVYVAEQISTGKERALKVMHARLVADSKQRERFVSEAVLASAVESDHVVEVISAGVEAPSGTPWIAMELLEGQDLNQHIRTHRGLGLENAMKVFRQVCHALGAAHDLSIVHRDLKPQNIFMMRQRSSDGGHRVKLLDFGIAKVVAESTLSTTAAVGSPAWMAPEQTDVSSDLGPAADVWAIGLLFFYAVTGKYYWLSANSERGSVEAVMREILLQPLAKGSERAAELGCAERWPPSLDPWLDRCLQREHHARFADASEAWLALERIQLEDALSATVELDMDAAMRRPEVIDETAQPIAGEARPASTRHRRLWLVALVCLSLGASAMMIFRQSVDPFKKPQPPKKPEFNRAAASAKIKAAVTQARAACSSPQVGARAIAATLTYFPTGGLSVQVSEDSHAGRCIAATMRQARMDRWGERGDKPVVMQAQVNLK